MIMKNDPGKMFLKFLHALSMSFLLLIFDQKYKFSNKNNMVSASRNFKIIFPRPPGTPELNLSYTVGKVIYTKYSKH